MKIFVCNTWGLLKPYRRHMTARRILSFSSSTEYLKKFNFSPLLNNSGKHERENPTPNLLDSDPSLKRALEAFSLDTGYDKVLTEYVQTSHAKNNFQFHAHQANINKPQLITLDMYGERIDYVDYHPSYHELMNFGITSGVCGGYTWNKGNDDKKKKASHVVRAAMMYLQNQMEPGKEIITSVYHSLTHSFGPFFILSTSHFH